MQAPPTNGTERFDTVIIGGGQAGLAMGYHLQGRHVPFVILDANDRVGHAWRNRWESLRLFTPTRYCALPGMRFPGRARLAPTKDEMADYLEAYVTRFDLPVCGSVRIDGLSKSGDTFVLSAGPRRYEASRVVVATGACNNPWTPAFAAQLSPHIVQLHSSDYRDRSQLQAGGVLLVGAADSGCDIALDVAAHHPTWLAGRHPGHVPFQIEGRFTHHLVRVLRFVGQHVLTRGTPIGRKAIPTLMAGGGPVVRIKPKDIAAAGVECVPRVAGVRDGRPVLEDDRVLDVKNVIWCTGFRPSFSWIDLGGLNSDGVPPQERGVVTTQPGLYFLGQEFQYAATSSLVTGVARDAAYLAKHIAKGSRLTPSCDTTIFQPVSSRDQM